MREPSIKELLKLYEEGKATEEQRRRVEEYLARYRARSSKEMKKPVDETEALEAILSGIRQAREQAGMEGEHELGGEEGAQEEFG